MTGKTPLGYEQVIKALVTKPNELKFNPWNPYGGKRKLSDSGKLSVDLLYTVKS